MQWIINMFAGGVFKIFGDTIVQPLLQAYLKSKDVDLQKFQAATPALEGAVVAVVEANTRFAEIQSGYALAILHWWPFRLVLWVCLAVAASRFCLILFDSTWWWVAGCAAGTGDACSWNIPPVKGLYGNAEYQFLLFFVIAKPVDSLVSGGISVLSNYLRK